MAEGTPSFIHDDQLQQLGQVCRQEGQHLLTEINAANLRLFDLPANKRIFLFILTRGMKSFSAIELLCQTGFGQDVASLVRSLMENLITAKYIIHDPATADQLARRFVEYKWVIFRRALQEDEINARNDSENRQQEFQARSKMVLSQVEAFKERYQIKSDRALLTWSGRTLKDMARKTSPELLAEYETAFRQYSRFSHPTILGDREYMVQDDQTLTFSPLPSEVGVQINFLNAMKYYVEFMTVANQLFGLQRGGPLQQTQSAVYQYLARFEEAEVPGKHQQRRDLNIHEVRVRFEI